MADVDPLKMDIDPVFKGGPQKVVDTENSPLLTGVSSILENQQYTPSSSAQTFPPIPTKTDIPKPAIRTYRDDIQSAIKANHLSSVNIAVAENDRMRQQVTGEILAGEVSEYSKSKVIIFISLLLIFIGAISIGATYLFTRVDNNNSVSVVTTSNSLITVEFKDEINIDSIVKGRLPSALASRINDMQIPINSVYGLYLTTGATSSKRILSSQELITALNWRIPDPLKRNLQNNYMIGMVSIGDNVPFLVFKTNSFETTYGGMIAWEKDLAKDFGPIFRLGNEVGLTDALAPTTILKFEDKVILNRDVRILKDTSGKVLFLYAILDRDTILITTSEVGFKDLLNRLNREKSLKR